MTNYRRNVVVGLTVLAALVMLGWMIVQFGANLGRAFAGERLNVRFVMERADGVSDGSALTFRGVVVGRVLRVWRDPDQHKVWAEAEVDAVPPLPAIASAEIRQTSALGTGANLALIPNGNGQNLKTGDTITANYIGLELLPAELKAVGPEIAAVVKQLRDENFVGNLNARVTEAGRMIEGVSKLVNDEKMQADLKASMANVRESSEKIKAISARAETVATNLDSAVSTVNETVKSARTKIEELNRSIQSRLDQTSAALEQIGQVTAKINAGTGTAGKLVNDPKLYAGLVDTTAELNATVKDLRRLIRQWEEEGVTAKLR